LSSSCGIVEYAFVDLDVVDDSEEATTTEFVVVVVVDNDCCDDDDQDCNDDDCKDCCPSSSFPTAAVEAADDFLCLNIGQRFGENPEENDNDYLTVSLLLSYFSSKSSSSLFLFGSRLILVAIQCLGSRKWILQIPPGQEINRLPHFLIDCMKRKHEDFKQVSDTVR
jgi:hypothetical protein